jgi:GNAT superfamily N-acetyltransferase
MFIERPLASEYSIDAILTASQAQQFSNLLDLCFSVPANSRFLDDFPVWDPKFVKNDILRLGMFEFNQLVACAAVRLAQLKLRTGKLIPIAMIGAVATHPRSRGKGFASKILVKTIEWARTRGADFIVLWGAEYSIYQKLGFEVCGEQIRVPLANLTFSNARTYPIFQEWSPAIFGLLKRRDEGLLLRESDRVWFESHKNVQWFFVGSRDAPQAYAAIGRGIDMKNIIHEWGGNSAQLGALLQFLQQKFEGLEIIGSRRSFHKAGVSVLSSTSDVFGISGYQEHLCLQKVLNPVRLPKGFWFWGLDAC